MQSLSRVAESLARTGRGEALLWEDVCLRSHFQPIFSVRRAACLGFEALVRAADSAGETIRPERLFAAANSQQKGVALDWACRALHLRNFAMVDPGDRQLFINVHPQTAVGDTDSARELGKLIRYYGLVPKRVCVEILEDGCTDEGLLREAVSAYRALGTTIAMDDFGRCRSNFDRIVRLRPDVVKIDRSILAEAGGDLKSRRMLPALIELLHEAGAQVAMEGIETADEALLAMDSGADLLQGFHFAAPSATLAHEDLGAGILGGLLRMRQPRLPAVGLR